MIHSVPDGVVVDIRVVPRASKAGVAGARADALLVRVRAPPVEGAANEEVVAVLADVLGVPRRAVSIVAGERSRHKRLHVTGVSAEVARKKLGLEGTADKDR